MCADGVLFTHVITQTGWRAHQRLAICRLVLHQENSWQCGPFLPALFQFCAVRRFCRISRTDMYGRSASQRGSSGTCSILGSRNTRLRLEKEKRLVTENLRPPHSHLRSQSLAVLAGWRLHQSAHIVLQAVAVSLCLVLGKGAKVLIRKSAQGSCPPHGRRR